MPDHGDFHQELAAAAREMQAEDSSQQAMERAVVIATQILTGCDAAGVCVLHRGERVDTHSSSTDALRKVDELQHELQEGPCVDALQQHDTVSSDDLSTDPRWPQWGPRVAELGYLSIVSYRLFSTERSLGALNLYSKEPTAFSSEDVHDGVALAAHVAVALAGAQEVESLEKAIGGRTVIGQATGILMERFDLAPDRAFGVLTRLSQQRNVKLRELAEYVVEHRTLPPA